MIHVGKAGNKRYELPVNLVTQVTAILARRGAGKSYTAKVLAEGLLEAKQQVIVLDPTDVWWGLRISEKGKPAYDVVIFGGEHADVPLVEASAEPLARLLATHPINAIISLDHLSKNGQRRFVTTFLEVFYEAKTPHEFRTPVHLFVDEADMFAPQRVQKGAERMLGAVDTIVRRGRTRGFGVTLITQRPATLHKDVLTQAELLVAMQITSPQDRKAVGEWISIHGDGMGFTASEVLAKLARFTVGQAIFWSPAWLNSMTEIMVRRAKTFDSSSTPDGSKVAAVKAPELDLKTINEQLAHAIEEAKANDPKELKREIARLTKELAAAQNVKPASEVVYAIPDNLNEIVDKAFEDGAAHVLRQIDEAMRDLFTKPYPGYSTEACLELHYADKVRAAKPVKGPINVLPNGVVAAQAKAAPPQAGSNVAAGRRQAPQRAATDTSEKLPAGVRKFLSVLVAHGECSLSKTSMLAGYSPKSSTVRNILSRARQWPGGALIDGSGKGPFTITQAGIDILGGDYDELPTGDALRQWWANQLGGAPQAIYLALVAAYPQSLDKDQLEEHTGYSASSSTIRNAFSKLRTMGLMVNDGQSYRVSDDLF